MTLQGLRDRELLHSLSLQTLTLFVWVLIKSSSKRVARADDLDDRISQNEIRQSRVRNLVLELAYPSVTEHTCIGSYFKAFPLSNLRH
jgi:hypothetical protein